MSKLAVIGIFFDGYKDLWDDFISLMNKYWPNCPYEKCIVNQTLDYDESSFRVLHAGADAEYSKKVQVAIKQIDADYFLLLLDDFFAISSIDNSRINEIIEYIDKNDLNYYSMPLPEFRKSYKGKRIPKTKSLREVSSKAEYTVSCQPAIWKKSFLEKCVGHNNYNAWIFEGIYSKSTYAHTKEFLCKCVADTSNPLNLRHGALQGKIIPDTYACLTKTGYKLQSNREILSKRFYFKHKIKSRIKSIIPLSVQKKLRKFIKIKSIFDKYSSDIFREMKELGIY